MFAHIFRRLIAITVIAAIAVLLSAPVGAAPEDGVARADSPTLSLRDLGSTPDLAFYGQNDVETVNIPVLPGLTPTSLNVTALLPVFARSATLTVLQDDRVIARYLDDLDLPEGSVITDTVYGFAVVVASRKPKTFVLPSDSDFVKLLNDPSAFGIKYLLTVPNTGRGVSDALNLRYPTLYETGAEVATLELEIPNDGDNQPDWRLYRVNEPTAAA